MIRPTLAFTQYMQAPTSRVKWMDWGPGSQSAAKSESVECMDQVPGALS